METTKRKKRLFAWKNVVSSKLQLSIASKNFQASQEALHGILTKGGLEVKKCFHFKNAKRAEKLYSCLKTFLSHIYLRSGDLEELLPDIYRDYVSAILSLTIDVKLLLSELKQENEDDHISDLVRDVCLYLCFCREQVWDTLLQTRALKKKTLSMQVLTVIEKAQLWVGRNYKNPNYYLKYILIVSFMNKMISEVDYKRIQRQALRCKTAFDFPVWFYQQSLHGSLSVPVNLTQRKIIKHLLNGQFKLKKILQVCHTLPSVLKSTRIKEGSDTVFMDVGREQMPKESFQDVADAILDQLHQTEEVDLPIQGYDKDIDAGDDEDPVSFLEAFLNTSLQDSENGDAVHRSTLKSPKRKQKSEAKQKKQATQDNTSPSKLPEESLFFIDKAGSEGKGKAAHSESSALDYSTIIEPRPDSMIQSYSKSNVLSPPMKSDPVGKLSDTKVEVLCLSSDEDNDRSQNNVVSPREQKNKLSDTKQKDSLNTSQMSDSEIDQTFKKVKKKNGQSLIINSSSCETEDAEEQSGKSASVSDQKLLNSLNPPSSLTCKEILPSKIRKSLLSCEVAVVPLGDSASSSCKHSPDIVKFKKQEKLHQSEVLLKREKSPKKEKSKSPEKNIKGIERNPPQDKTSITPNKYSKKSVSEEINNSTAIIASCSSEDDNMESIFTALQTSPNKTSCSDPLLSPEITPVKMRKRSGYVISPRIDSSGDSKFISDISLNSINQKRDFSLDTSLQSPKKLPRFNLELDKKFNSLNVDLNESFKEDKETQVEIKGFTVPQATSATQTDLKNTSPAKNSESDSQSSDAVQNNVFVKKKGVSKQNIRATRTSTRLRQRPLSESDTISSPFSEAKKRSCKIRAKESSKDEEEYDSSLSKVSESETIMASKLKTSEINDREKNGSKNRGISNRMKANDYLRSEESDSAASEGPPQKKQTGLRHTTSRRNVNTTPAKGNFRSFNDLKESGNSSPTSSEEPNANKSSDKLNSSAAKRSFNKGSNASSHGSSKSPPVKRRSLRINSSPKPSTSRRAEYLKTLDKSSDSENDDDNFDYSFASTVGIITPNRDEPQRKSVKGIPEQFLESHPVKVEKNSPVKTSPVKTVQQTTISTPMVKNTSPKKKSQTEPRRYNLRVRSKTNK